MAQQTDATTEAPGLSREPKKASSKFFAGDAEIIEVFDADGMSDAALEEAAIIKFDYITPTRGNWLSEEQRMKYGASVLKKDFGNSTSAFVAVWDA
jgi:hypothetical protein